MSANTQKSTGKHTHMGIHATHHLGASACSKRGGLLTAGFAKSVMMRRKATSVTFAIGATQ